MNDRDLTYNERLFSGGLRARIHLARFLWLSRSLTERGVRARSVLELGCYDAKTLRFLPEMPERYVGLDANLEGGLDLARQTWTQDGFSFIECRSPEEVDLDGSFDISVCMETFEYLPPDSLEGYIALLAELTDRYIFVTTSNQTGPVFAAKYLGKRLLGHGVPAYTAAEFANAAIGNMAKVSRDGRKGWDYRLLIGTLSKHFRIVEVAPYPLKALPVQLGFGVCILGERRELPGART